MPRLLLTIALLAAAAAPMGAEESQPSNTVGYIAWDCAPGAWTPFAFPFTYYRQGHQPTFSLNDILTGTFTAGNQTTADRVYDQNTGATAYFSELSGQWEGNLTQIVPGRAYWLRVNAESPAARAVSAGEVDLTQITIGTMAAGMFTPAGLRDPGAVPLNASRLVESGFTGGDYFSSDRVFDQNTLSFSYYDAAVSAWRGALQGLQPAHALWIMVQAGHNGFEWVYTPPAGLSRASLQSADKAADLSTERKQPLKPGTQE